MTTRSTSRFRLTRRTPPFPLGSHEDFCVRGFHFTRTGLTVSGNPSFDDWLRIGEFIRLANHGAPWWWGDWLRYGESRPDWQDRWTQALETSGYEAETLGNLKYVAENVHPSRRRDDVSFSHHAEVAKLHPKDQQRWLKTAADEDLSKRDLREAIRRDQRRTVSEGTADLHGRYRVIYADPPWAYRDNGVIQTGDNYGRAERHYPTMTAEEIGRLPVAAPS